MENYHEENIIRLYAFGIGCSFADVNTTVDIRVGTGKYICTAEGMDKNPSLVRSNSRSNAEDLALEQCADIEGSDFFCEIKKCVQDENSSNLNVNIGFSISRSGSNIDINLNNGVAGYRCTTEAFRSRYKATAPTRLEAEVLVRKTCMNDGNHGMHCDDIERCVKLENENSGGGSISIGNDNIDINGAIDIFKKLKRK